MSVSAVIPVHNRANLLGELLASMRRQTVPFDEILVVDNASTDNAPDLARAAGCEVISMGTNAGFAAAVNRGWRAAKSDWIAILNSDVELDPAWLERLLQASKDASFATGKILNHANPALVDATYDLLSRSGCAWRAGSGHLDYPDEKTKPISLAPGTACLFRRDILNRLNGFDETYGSYLEDVDLGLRCLEAGFTGVYVPSARALHHGSATLGRWNPKVVKLISRNQLRLVSSHYNLRTHLWPVIAGQVLWGLVALRHRAFRAWFAGKWDGIRHFQPEGKHSAAVEDFLEASEREIQQAAKDAYWRVYFGLV